MNKLTQEQIHKILENHKHWLNEDCEGWENMKADFSSCDLRGANLCDANLGDANLRGANLGGTYLRGAYLGGANLRDANLCDANLRGANLRGANLRGAYLCDANLGGANLRGANLGGIYLGGANLGGANLRDAEEVPYIPMVCPEEGDFIGWKKAGNKIVKLRIPEDALRSSATTRKCRAGKAKVLSITNINGTENFEEAISCHNPNFIYKIGEIVEVEDFDEDRWNECSTGIHHFITRDEAVNYDS